MAAKLTFFCLLLTLLAGCKGSCDQQKATKPAAFTVVEPKKVVWVEGFETILDWVGAEGRIATVLVLENEEIRDGEMRFGNHGEFLGPEPKLRIIDRVAGRDIPADDVVARAPNNEFLVIRRAQELILINARTAGEEVIPNVDLRPDNNPCQPNRSALFDPTGTYLGWVTKDNKFRVRELRTKAEKTFVPPSNRTIWRGQPGAHADWVTLQTIDTPENGEVEFPRSKTSCRHRWAKRFAESIGFYGWQGEFDADLVRDDGKVVKLSRMYMPITREHLLDREHMQLYTADETMMPPIVTAFYRLPIVARYDKEGLILENLETGERTPLGKLHFWSNLHDPWEGRWVYALKSDTSETVRLDVLTGAMDIGPVHEGQREGPNRFGWWIFTRPDKRLTAWDMKSGELKESSIKVNVPGMVYQTGKPGTDEWWAMDPVKGTVIRLPWRPGLVLENGCAFKSERIYKKLEMYCP